MENKISRQSIIKLPYPQNLLTAILQGTDLPVPDITDDIIAGLNYAVSTLSYREQEILRRSYVERQTQKSTAEYFSVSSSRISSLERQTLRKLRSASRVPYILYGEQGLKDREAAIAREKLERFDAEKYKTILSIRFEELDLTVRSFNCLRRAGYEKVADIIGLTEDEILGIKNLGRKNLDEIARKLLSVGVEESSWLCFIM